MTRLVRWSLVGLAVLLAAAAWGLWAWENHATKEENDTYGIGYATVDHWPSYLLGGLAVVALVAALASRPLNTSRRELT